MIEALRSNVAACGVAPRLLSSGLPHCRGANKGRLYDTHHHYIVSCSNALRYLGNDSMSYFAAKKRGTRGVDIPKATDNRKFSQPFPINIIKGTLMNFNLIYTILTLYLFISYQLLINKSARKTNKLIGNCKATAATAGVKVSVVPRRTRRIRSPQIGIAATRCNRKSNRKKTLRLPI